MIDHTAFPEAPAVSLSDAEIAERLAVYNAGGDLRQRLDRMWSRASDVIMDCTREHRTELLAQLRQSFPPERRDHPALDISGMLETVRSRYSAPIDAAWMRTQAGSGVFAAQLMVPVPTIVVSMSRETRMLSARIEEKFPDDLDFIAFARETCELLHCIVLDLMLTQVNAIRLHEAATSRVAATESFRDAVGDIVNATLQDSARLRDQTVGTSTSARGMLGKASEVAAAAEQSAVAMREAAQTAAGLIRAIEDARGEVEVAAGIATRAADQSAKAVAVSEALSDHAQAIESILGLIRDIAGQTNLLALNATIEAARAGDAGRGFAVVAQEVKSLANATARATDDIAAKIAAIQTVTRQTVDANGSIRDTVGEVQSSAQRIRHAMETQAQTVTMITAAVDETALAADSMSSTIAAIRADTENVAGEIDRLETGFRSVDAQLSSLETTASAFISRIAA
jgi:methyl-accepting chemotaxis protein